MFKLNTFNLQRKNYTRRKSERIQRRLEISIVDFSTKKIITAQSTDFSRGGMGIKCRKKINPKDNLEIWIHLPNITKPIHRFGKVVWVKPLSPTVLRAGIKFCSHLDFAY